MNITWWCHDDADDVLISTKNKKDFFFLLRMVENDNENYLPFDPQKLLKRFEWPNSWENDSPELLCWHFVSQKFVLIFAGGVYVSKQAIATRYQEFL